VKVAVYAIALDEAAHVERWANSVADADYRIVADTGSTDDTVERLIAAGVTVHRIAIRPWRFDDARNTAMALIPADADICLSMDMDEFLEPGWRPKLEAAWIPETTAVWCQKLTRSRVDDPTILSSFPVKKFHCRWGYRVRRPVHEVLTFTGEKEVTRDGAGIELHHVQDHTKTTRQQYLPLMELALKEDPQESQICFWLGREYMWANQNERAAEVLQRYLALPSSTWADERSEAMRYLARMQPDKKMLWLDKARMEAPHRREVWKDLAEEFHNQADWLNLFWACSNGIEKTRRTGSYLDDAHCWGFRLFDLGAIASWRLNVMDRAVEWGQRSLELTPNDQRHRLQTNLDFFIKSQGEVMRSSAPSSHQASQANTKSAGEVLRSPSKRDRRPLVPGHKIKKGVICDIEFLTGYICHETYYFVKLLQTECGFDIVDSKTTDFQSADIIEKLNTYDVLLIAYHGWVQRDIDIPIDKLSPYIIFRVDDLVSYDDAFDRLLSRLISESDMIISPYAYAFHQFFKHDNVVWLPYSCGLEAYPEVADISFNTDPLRKVLVSGSVEWDRPFRQHAAGLKSEHIEVLQHPGYGKRYDDNDTVGARYYREVNKYLCGFCDAHQYRYLHLKNFEIAAVGSLLLADKLVEKEMNELGFVDYETCIFADIESFVDRVSWICDEKNREAVDRIRRAGMELVRAKHLTKHRVLQLNNLVEKSLSFRGRDTDIS
jgi:glycosyltransferase involved in cell wall biosynthesis